MPQPSCMPGCGSSPRLGRIERERAVEMFRALSDPTRLEIFRLAAARGASLCVCEIVERFDLTQPTISHHLKVLRKAGLVTVSRRGTWAHYAADPVGLARFRTAVDRIAGASHVAVPAGVGG